MIAFNLEACFTLGEQIIKYCLKFLLRNSQYRAAGARITHCRSCRLVYGTLRHLSHTVQMNKLSLTVAWSTV